MYQDLSVFADILSLLTHVFYYLHNSSPAVVFSTPFLQRAFVSDIAIFVLKRDVKLQLTNFTARALLALQALY